MLRLLFMPWYTYKASNVTGKNYFNLLNTISQPFTYNNVVYDYDNIRGLITKIYYHSTNNKITKYLVSVNDGSSYFSFYDSSTDYFVGFPSLVFCEESITSNLFTEINTTFISGKYTYNNKTVSFINDSLISGITLPIKFSINGINFKYMVISSYNAWRHGRGTSTKYVCGYNTPYNIKGNSAPADFHSYEINIGNTIDIDFGNTSQEIPQFVYDWFVQQFDKIYENVYAIKSVTGEALTTLTEAPPMISATLSAVGNAKYLTLTGENNNNYTMEWTSEAPQGKIFAGLATSKGGSIAIPVGETSTINLTDSTDLYEVWQTYRPPTTTFDINLYKNSAEPNKVDKTAELSTVGTISGVLRQECSLINPEIIIQYDKPPDFNYCYIANFGRYYYVENIVSMRQNLWRVRLRCDVLMTYKTQILNLNARIARQQYTYSYRQIDSEIPFTNDPEITVQDIPNNLNLGKPHYENILLTVVGNGT